MKEPRARSPKAVELDETRSGHLLRKARRTGVSVQILTTDEAPLACGRIVDVSDDALEIVLEDSPQPAQVFDAETDCQVRFTLSKEPCQFVAGVIRAADADGCVRVRLQRPKHLTVRQRRRFWRTEVSESSTVELVSADRALRCCGAMLNVSPGGLACRIERPLADQLNIGDGVHLRFDLDGDEEPFSLDGRIRAMTPASDTAQMIVGLQFDPISLSTRDQHRIRCATHAPAVMP